MLLVPHSATPFWRVDNWGAGPATNTIGTSVAPGASNAEGAWTQLFSGATVANDVYGFYLNINGGASSASSKPHLLDIGIDPAGGTSYTSIMNNLVCGDAPAPTSQGNRAHFFPLFIKAGSSIAARVQGTAATAGTIRIAMRLYGRLSRPEGYRVGTFTETIGAITASNGVSFTPGSTGVWGSWTSVGTTAKDLWWWQLGIQIDNATIAAEVTWVELAVGDGTTFQTICLNQYIMTTSEVVGCSTHCNMNPFEGYMPVKAGSTLYVRGMCNLAPTTGYNCNVIGVGG